MVRVKKLRVNYEFREKIIMTVIGGEKKVLDKSRVK